MSATDRWRGLPALARRSLLAILATALGAAGMALAADSAAPDDRRVADLLKARLPRTSLDKVSCGRIGSLCEVTAGANLFYVDHGARYLVIGRIYDMQTRQDLTAARLLEINPDMLVGGAAKANAAAAQGGEEEGGKKEGGKKEGWGAPASRQAMRRTPLPAPPAILPLSGLPREGAIVWGNKTARQTVTIFTDFRCSYCRALTMVLRDMDVRIVERPISVLGSRAVAEQVYCAKNQERALHAAYAGEPVGAGARCDTSGLDANERFAQQHGLNGTPVIVRSDGAMIEGYRPRQFLETWLKGGKS